MYLEIYEGEQKTLFFCGVSTDVIALQLSYTMCFPTFFSEAFIHKRMSSVMGNVVNSLSSSSTFLKSS